VRLIILSPCTGVCPCPRLKLMLIFMKVTQFVNFHQSTVPCDSHVNLQSGSSSSVIKYGVSKFFVVKNY
jgi:hypothetical protein